MMPIKAKIFWNAIAVQVPFRKSAVGICLKYDKIWSFCRDKRRNFEQAHQLGICLTDMYYVNIKLPKGNKS